MQVLEVNDLRKTFSRRGDRVDAVKNVSFTAGKGEIVGLLGPNGAGKTSVVKMISGVLLPDAGTVFIDGRDALAGRAARRGHCTVLEGSRNMYWQLTAKENLIFFAGIHGISRKTAASKAVSVLSTLGLSEKSGTPAGSLSRGMQQKLAFGIAMMKDVPLIILDEPTLGLDVESTSDMRRLLTSYAKDHGKTVLITTHDMQLVEGICDRAIIMSKGLLLTDSPVADLKRLFRGRSYTITLTGQSPSLFEKLTAHEARPVWNDGSDGTLRVEVTLPDARRLYSFLDILREEGVLVESMEKDDMHFEDIFLKVIREENT